MPAMSPALPPQRMREPASSAYTVDVIGMPNVVLPAIVQAAGTLMAFDARGISTGSPEAARVLDRAGDRRNCRG